MFVIFLKFARNKSRAPEFMAAHNEWIKQGFEDGVFLVTGSLAGGAGGAILAHGLPLEKLQSLLNADPFVAQGVVTPEIHEFKPGRTAPGLEFLT